MYRYVPLIIFKISLNESYYYCNSVKIIITRCFKNFI